MDPEGRGGSRLSTAPETLRRIEFMGLRLDPMDEGALNDCVLEALRSRRQVWISNLNVHAVNLANRDPEVRDCFRSADRIFCDGKGLALVLGLLGMGKVPRVTYNQWLPDLLRLCHREGRTMFFLGDRVETLEKARSLAEARFPGVVAGVHHGYFPADEADRVVESVNEVDPDILVVGMGMPRQERFIRTHRDALRARVLLNGGACFKYFAGERSIAPRWLSDVGMEWSHRLLCEPRRLAGRYLLGNPRFLLDCLVWKGRQIRRRGSRAPELRRSGPPSVEIQRAGQP
jgi:N-acetylglucosaminyldiphosphoundecaprenol N-acetyl-beta-D-mannosaminyltransferase